MPESIWKRKIENANKYYKLWENRFQCKTLEDYWEGFQWRQIVDIPYYKPYVVNLFYSELKRKLANILYQQLQYNLTPRPGHYAVNPEFAFSSAIRKQDFLNDQIARANKDKGFNEQVKLTAMDSFFRFGVMEVGYAADWRNPAKKPLVTTTHDSTTEKEEDGRVVEDEEVPENERIFYKRIKASRFRVSMSDDTRLENCSWCGYYSYIYKHVLKKTKGLTLPVNLESYTAGYSSEYISSGSRIPQDSNRASADSKDMLEALRAGKVCRVWNIWDNENNSRKLLLEPTYEEIFEADFYWLPFATHRHDLRLDGWYPMPPIWQWLASQDEINQAREQMRNYRRRFTRKYEYYGIDQEELEKFKSETDGEVIKHKNPNSYIRPIGNPEIGISIQDALNAGRDDFNTVSGSSSDLSTSQADRTSATQSKITAAKAQVIESVEQIEFEGIYHKIGRLTLLEAQTKLSSGIWVKNSLDPYEVFLGQINTQRVLPVRYITAQDLDDGYDYDTEITCINASPQRMQEELTKFTQFLTIVSQFPQISLSPDLIREAAYRVGYRNEKVIAAMQQTALIAMMGQAQQMAQKQGMDLGQLMGQGAGGNNPINMLRNAQPAGTEDINNQLANQLG
jgi:hypothetical protein